MVLNKEQVSNLLQFVASVSPDGINCEACLEQVPELAESQLGNRPLTEILTDVQNHIDNCPCCCKEYAVFLEALYAIAED